nr:DUF4113 domain-containing protein [Pseudomonas fulva]
MASNGAQGHFAMKLHAQAPRYGYPWGMRREMMSQSFTTRVDELWTVYCK